MLNLMERLKDNKEIAEENIRIRRSKKALEKDYLLLQEKYNDRNDKYISLLEEKGEGFNQYQRYHDLYSDSVATLKENKKDIADLKTDIKKLNEILTEKDKTITARDTEIAKLRKKIAKEEDK